ncbi:hypothetical protein DNTS_033293 [Danionella cerebrum]|uniref:Uncharacterized protein n=1 Tax=Danionella cerebrum TaxID=2873325 RepID=A0A553NAM7_9TELE|nr:hypothetical protein DNTS_033293 [Danionella translucida]
MSLMLPLCGALCFSIKEQMASLSSSSELSPHMWFLPPLAEFSSNCFTKATRQESLGTSSELCDIYIGKCADLVIYYIAPSSKLQNQILPCM